MRVYAVSYADYGTTMCEGQDVTIILTASFSKKPDRICLCWKAGGFSNEVEATYSCDEYSRYYKIKGKFYINGCLEDGLTAHLSGIAFYEKRDDGSYEQRKALSFDGAEFYFTVVKIE